MDADDPSTWARPDWHPDWSDAGHEVAMLRTVALDLVRRSPEWSVELVFFEEGYMHINIFVAGRNVGEVYPVAGGHDRDWTLGFDDGEGLHEFGTPEDLVTFIDREMRPHSA